jgi:hypothetical protein
MLPGMKQRIEVPSGLFIGQTIVLLARETAKSAPARNDVHPFLALHREMNRMFDDVFCGFDLAPFGSFRASEGLDCLSERRSRAGRCRSPAGQ